MLSDAGKKIAFHANENVEHPFLDTEQEYINWINGVAGDEKKTISNLTYIFCTDEFLLDINIKYLGHDYYTDIITFPYKEGEDIESDLYISLDRVKENAEEYNVSFTEELKRVMIHGFLHLMGYDDKNDDDLTEMRKKEDHYIARFNDYN